MQFLNSSYWCSFQLVCILQQHQWISGMKLWLLVLVCHHNILVPPIWPLSLASDNCQALLNCIYFKYTPNTHYSAKNAQNTTRGGWDSLYPGVFHSCIRFECISSDHLWLGFTSLLTFVFLWGDWLLLSRRTEDYLVHHWVVFLHGQGFICTHNALQIFYTYSAHWRARITVYARVSWLDSDQSQMLKRLINDTTASKGDIEGHQ